jgi:hypothetical protein
MKNLIIIIILLLAGLNGFGQDYFGNRNSIKIKYLTNLVGEYSDTAYYYFEDTIDKLTVSKTGYDKMTATYIFSFDSTFGHYQNMADQIILKYYRKEYVENHIDFILNGTENKWIEVEDNYYLTKNKIAVIMDIGGDGSGLYYSIGAMNIIRPKNDEVFLKIRISMVGFDRKEWKKLVKKQ